MKGGYHGKRLPHEPADLMYPNCGCSGKKNCPKRHHQDGCRCYTCRNKSHKWWIYSFWSFAIHDMSIQESPVVLGFNAFLYPPVLTESFQTWCLIWIHVKHYTVNRRHSTTYWMAYAVHVFDIKFVLVVIVKTTHQTKSASTLVDIVTSKSQLSMAINSCFFTKPKKYMRLTVEMPVSIGNRCTFGHSHLFCVPSLCNCLSFVFHRHWNCDIETLFHFFLFWDFGIYVYNCGTDN